MLLPLLYFEAAGAVLLYLVSGMALKVETSRRLSSGKLAAPKEDNIHHVAAEGAADKNLLTHQRLHPFFIFLSCAAFAAS